MTGLSSEETVISLDTVDLDARVFSLLSDEAATQLIDPATVEDGDQCAQAKVTKLPSTAFHGIWDSLVFDELIQVKLLRFIMRMSKYHYLVLRDPSARRCCSCSRQSSTQ